mmetsp:Transcript_7952/g.20370  ORF Transcript_7952/g.20370 Transcript_7952/m.20370 type:complete len:130 (-) Transcript_7952:386-775(-)
MVRKFAQGRIEASPVGKKGEERPGEEQGGAKSTEIEGGIGPALAKPEARFKPAHRSHVKPELKPFSGDAEMRDVHFVKSDKDLEDLIENSRKTSSKLFVEFGTPWCEHCKSMIPTMMEFGRKVSRAVAA